MSTPNHLNWATDYDVVDPAFVKDPYPVYEELRGTCPVAHTDRWGGSWLPTKYDDVVAIAHDVEHFSSAEVGVIRAPEGAPDPFPMGLPPITSDPPVHTWSRRLLLPWFSHTRVAEYEVITRELCRSLIRGFIEDGKADAAQDYAQQIPVRIIAKVLGVPAEMSDDFTSWVRDVLEFAYDPERLQRGQINIFTFFMQALEERKVNPGDDLISELAHTKVEGEAIPDAHVLGTAALTLLAGVDTTWSAIGSALWHLATHPADRQRLIDDPEIMPFALEELLRAYSPVTMARIVTEDFEYNGCPMHKGDNVLLAFPAANRDPDVFPNPDVVDFDREQNRHIAFGSGIHRCAGANLARMELRVAVEEWLAMIPEFGLTEGAEVTWAGGQVRGPRMCPVSFGE
ncbi:MAG: cytochrome P450 [Actinomycetota bacterium]